MYNKMDSRTQLVCRTCLEEINGNGLYVNVDSETKYGNLTVILETCVSELNLDLSDGVVMCCNCITMLKISYEFKLRCIKTENKIFEYLKQHNLPIFGKVNLADVITNVSHLENSFIDLTSEKYSQTENVVTIHEEIAERVLSNNYSLPMVDMNCPKKDNSCPEHEDDINIDYVLQESAVLNRTENLNMRNYNEDILMFDNLTNTDDMNNYRIIPVQENDTYRNMTSNIETISPDESNDMDWNMTFERCRLNSSKERYCERVSEIPSYSNDFEDNSIR